MQFEVEAIDYVEMVFEIDEVDRIPRPVYRVAPGYPYKLEGSRYWRYSMAGLCLRCQGQSPGNQSAVIDPS